MCIDDPTCYGLLQLIECYCADEIGIKTKSFNFLHSGIQEHFAANYVAISLKGVRFMHFWMSRFFLPITN